MLTFSGQRQNINKVKALIAEVVQVVVRRMQQVILMWICLQNGQPYAVMFGQTSKILLCIWKTNRQTEDPWK